MDWISVIMSSIAAVIGAMGGGGIFLIRQNKTAKKIENEAAQSAEWRKLYDEVKAELHERDEKIDRIYDEKKVLRNEMHNLSKRITELEVEQTKNCIYRCEVPGCKKRQPPTGF